MVFSGLRVLGRGLEWKVIVYFLLTVFIFGSAKRPDEKKSKEDDQTLTEVIKFGSSPFTSKMSGCTN